MIIFIKSNNNTTKLFIMVSMKVQLKS